MDFIRIKQITEPDFDSIVQAAGGSRITSQGSADYELNEAVIELKFVQEEGFEKAPRQAKLAKLFCSQQPSTPVVILDPDSLGPTQTREYYRILARPIKKHVAKAAKQLDATANRYTPPRTRLLVLMNLGYTALAADEFESVCLKCVRNDTTKIDFVVCGGIYLHSDKFDNYLLPRFDLHPVNLDRPFPSFGALLNAWQVFEERLATSMITEPPPQGEGRLPVIDLMFDLDGIRYVKPAPVVPSNVFPGGRAPRTNSSGLDHCPPVELVFAALSPVEWAHFKQALPQAKTLKGSHAEYLALQHHVEATESKTLQPVVPFPVTFDDFRARITKPLADCTYTEISAFAANQFKTTTLQVLDRVREKTPGAVLPLEYLHVVVQEIGDDEANDLASIYHVHDTPGFQREQPIFENQRLFLNYALAVAASYAVKRRLDYVLFSKVRRCN